MDSAFPRPRPCKGRPPALALLLVSGLLLPACLKHGEMVCGNGVEEPGEACDCGSGASPPPGCHGLNSDSRDGACRRDCSAPRCGDGVLDSSLGEGCDDGNSVSGDACPSGTLGTCSPAHCGDGIRWLGFEDCDGQDLGGQDCASLGLGGGQLSCDASCVFDPGACSG